MGKSINLAVLILAAGTSSRLGEPKQLLNLKGKSLINIAIEKALELTSNVTVVLGHKNDEVKKEIENKNINIIINPNYEDGMGNTIAFGVSNIKEEKVLIMLCDQPLIPIEHYENLIKLSNENKDKIICSQYKNQHAVPTIFPKKYFEELKKLKGNKGAKQLFLKYEPISIVLADNYSIDVDTKEDWQELLKNS
ncbi:MobA-like molybdenum cofactor biosynthesis protein [Arcobacter nitrofigilis DSM 7299]|uniref:MobA-like molybdenum cofactor biosynthesis protein n=1 Tax=Arcobacter nitrofigilis (strain ATCC 33309 / DSM 7299 / CCUG 15893 / LMG 7604 / NCTC 12251 / CI) TaxID=572480 RepID=D5V626_ARCNC|nr:nucleotidyltransferase family protein [Arcobacter nitrofigilis]ADG93193.1 MobA-like molybdenum cofactor biosynthesis protein [Arcobacter nitrofigilis DSM 7299]